MASIRLEELDKVYPNGRRAVCGLSLAVADGELLVLVGPSGCGKTTTLRLVAGLERPSGGRLFLDGREATHLPPQRRDVAMVFQNYALYPHLTVRGNLEFGLRLRRTPRAVTAERVDQVARVLELGPLLERKPAELSGGERQRVALGRAVVRQPVAFLLDEPLSNLDARLRLQTRAELARLHGRLRATMLYVTHDQEEALTLGDRVAVLRDGTLQQVAPPAEVYARPANAFVAGFVGAPAMNFFRCTPRGVEGGVRLESACFNLALKDGAWAVHHGEVLLGVRPHDLRLVAPGQGEAAARVDLVQPLGRDALVHLNLIGPGGPAATLVGPADTPVRAGDRVGVRFPPDRLHLFDAHTGLRLGGPA